MDSDPSQQDENVVLEKGQRQTSAVLPTTVVVSALGLLISIFRWKLVAFFTPFIEPFFEFVVFGAFCAAFIWSLVYALVPMRGFTRKRLLPFAVALAALLIFVFFPFTKMTLKADFYFNLAERTAAAERIVRDSKAAVSGEGGRGDRVELPGLSESDEGFYWHNQSKQLVLFLTFRGILGHFSGFVYSATDASPEDEDFGCRLVQVEHFRPKWYWVACD